MTALGMREAPTGLVEGPGHRGWMRPIIYVVLVLLAIVWLVPFAWAVATSLKPDAETTVAPVSWLAFQGVARRLPRDSRQGRHPPVVLQQHPHGVGDHGGTIFTASLAAFAFSRMRFAGRGFLMWILLAGLIVPFQALIVPLFAEMKSFGLADTYWGVILPQIAAPIAVLVYKRAFDAVPRELEESALVDGASMWLVYRRIWMPLSRATTAAVGIFTFVLAWNNFFWPFVITSAGDLSRSPSASRRSRPLTARCTRRRWRWRSWARCRC